jgi:hypothetical protein
VQFVLPAVKPLGDDRIGTDVATPAGGEEVPWRMHRRAQTAVTCPPGNATHGR